MTGRRVVVIGGGVSGIAATHHLAKVGFRPTLLEGRARLGGRAGAAELDGELLDFGGKNIGRRYDEFRTFASEVAGVGFSPFGISSAQVRDGRLVAYDGNSHLRSLRARLRGWRLADIARFSRMARLATRDGGGFIGAPSFEAIARRHDVRTTATWFGQACLDAVIRPMTVRMNGAEPDEAWLGNIGTNLRMLLDSFDQVDGGLHSVFDSFAANADVRTSATATAIETGRSGVRGVAVRERGRDLTIECEAVVVALPAPTARPLVAPLSAELDRLLGDINYYPVTVVMAKYAKPIFPEHPRAVVFGEDEAVSNAGVYAPDRRDIVRYTFSGREGRRFADECALLSSSASTRHLVERGEKTLAAVMPVEASDRRAARAITFDPGLCAYGPRHHERVERIRRAAAGVRGLGITGDWAMGSSIEACFRAARRCVDGLSTHSEADRYSERLRPA